MKKSLKTVFVILAIIMLLALSLSFDPVAQKIGEWFSWPVEKIKSVAKTVLFVLIGAFLIYSGIAALAVPVVGVVLVVVGLALIGLALYPFFSQAQESQDIID